MDLKGFLSLVTPDQGFRFIVAIQKGKDGRRIHEAYKTMKHAEETVEAMETWNDFNTYFSCASFEKAEYKDERTGRTKKRTKANAIYARAIWRDFDVGCNEDGDPKPNAYASREECIEAVEKMCTTIGLPLPLMVSSGNGIHAYWPFNRNVPKEEWLRIASLAVKAFGNNGVLSDASRDCDIASILRPPGAMHKGKYPNSPHKKVRIMYEGDGVLDPDEFVSLLIPPAGTEMSADEFLNAVPEFMKVSAITEALANTREFPPSYADKIADKCAIIGEFREKGGTDYFLWFLQLGLVKFTVEGEEKAHEWSAKYDGYDRAETQFKLDEWDGKATTCKAFSAASDKCKSCKFFGKIGSPMALGIEETRPQETIEVEVEAEQGEEPEVEKYPLPPGYHVHNGILCKLAVIDDIPTYLEITHSVFWFESRYRAITGEMVFKVNSRVRKEGSKWEYHTFELPAGLVGKGGSELHGKLGEREIFPSQKKGAKMRLDEMTVAMANQLREKAKEVKAYRNFGWDAEGEGFIIGDTRITKDGDHKVVIAGDSAPTILPAFKSNKGSAGEWAEIVEQMYARPDHAAYQTVVLFGIGSPLLKFYQMPTGCLVNLVGDKGLGKTTTCAVAISAYGNPSMLMTELRSTTELALYDRLATHHSIPCSIDELTNVEPLKMSNMAYTIMNAKPRERLANTGKRNVMMTEWGLVTFGASNGSIRDVLGGFKADASAELSRLIELDWPKIETIERREMDALLTKLRGHWGAMGKEFVSWVVRNQRKAEKLLYGMREHIEDELKIDKENRFWSAHIAVPLTTKLILEKMGYFDSFSFEEIMALCFSTIREHKETMTDMTLNSDEAFNAMLTSFSDRIISTQTLKDNRLSTPDGVIMHGEPVGRAVLQTDDLYLSVAAIREWCGEKRVNYKKMRKDLVELGVLKGDARFFFGRGTTRLTGQTYSWHLDLKRVLGCSGIKVAASETGHLKLVG